MAVTSKAAPPPLYGKFRGQVIDNEDPLRRGRLLCLVPSLELSLNWALPCAPYAGPAVGLYLLPPIGATVWVEFEGGNPEFAVWSGGFWEEDELPVAASAAPATSLVKVLSTACSEITLDDTPATGGVTVEAGDPAVEVPVTLKMSVLGFSVSVGDLALTMDPEVGITLTAGETTLTLTPEGAVLEATDISMTATDVNIEGTTTVTGDTAVTGAVEITGDVDVNGDTNLVGALTVEGESNLVGALTVEGETNLLGALTVEGDANVAGAVEIEGDLALLGAAEMVDLMVGLINGLTYPPII